MKRFTTNILSALTLIFFAGSLSAQWTLIEDWEDGDADGWYFTRNQNPEGDGGHRFFEDPAGQSGTVHYLETDGIGENFANLFAARNLPEPIEVGEVATMYFRYYQTGPFNGVHIGTTNQTVDPELSEEELLATHSFGSYEVLVKMHQNDGFQVRDASDYKFVEGFTDMEENVWYEFWIVIDNSDAQEYKTYVRGGDMFPTQTLLQVPELDADGNPTGNTFDTALFRNGRNEPQTVILLGAFGGNPNAPVIPDPHYFDDFYMDFSGENLEAPVSYDNGGATWAGYPVDANGDVDTDSWMGFLNVTNKPWVWNYSLSKWLYIDEPASDAPGGWAYVSK